MKIAALAAALWLAQPVMAAPPDEADAAAVEAALDDAITALENAVEAGEDAAPAPRPQPEPRPAIWLLQDEDTKIYLFGTFHILPEGYRWRSPTIDGVIRQADELVLEISDRDQMTDAAALAQGMMLGKTAPILWRVSPGRREALQALVEETGLPIQTFDGMQSWAVVMIMAVFATIRDFSGDDTPPLDADNMPGVEDALVTEFEGLDRPITGVETVAQQMGFFSGLSFADQRNMLESMVDDYRRGKAGGGATLDVEDWVRGDAEAIMIGRDEMPPVLYDALITRRNRAWTDWLIARLARPGTILFAVGAGHLAGPDSVQTMLAGRGMTVARLN